MFDGTTHVTKVIIDEAKLSDTQLLYLEDLWKKCSTDGKGITAENFESLLLLFTQVCAPHCVGSYRDIARSILRDESNKVKLQNNVSDKLLLDGTKYIPDELWKKFGYLDDKKRAALKRLASALNKLDISFQDIRVASWKHRLAAAEYYEEFIAVKKLTGKPDTVLDEVLQPVLERAAQNGAVKCPISFRRYAHSMHFLKKVCGEFFYFILPDQFVFSPKIVQAFLDQNGKTLPPNLDTL